MILDTTRLTLRPLSESDLDAVHAYSSDPKVCEFIEWGPNTLLDTKEFLRRSIRLAKQTPRLNYDFAIVLKGSGENIGNVGLFMHDTRCLQAMMGYVLASDHWGKGIATEAAGAMLTFGFNKLKLHRISAMCDLRNIGSFRVMESCGMRREGLFVQEKFVKGKWRDTLMYSILAHEWSEKASANRQ
jgi:[ribosomal protein S5]-alanine N-acetyltransferase